MNRRELLGQSLASVGTVAAATTFLSQNAFAKKTMASAGPKPLIKAASDCSTVAEECLTHCLDLLAQGDKMMGDCAKTVRDCITACDGLLKLAQSDSKHLKEYAKVCAAICRDCQKACEKHADHHDVCKRCAEACDACATECEKL